MATYAESNQSEKLTPISAFQFQVYTEPRDGQINWLPQGKVGFTNVSGLGNSTEAIEYKEGNDLYGDMLPGRSRPSGDITLSRGLDLGAHLIAWRSAILERTALPAANARCTVIVELYDRTGVEGARQSPTPMQLVQRWRIPDAWPKDYAVDDLDARGGTEITIQRATLAHLGVPEMTYPINQTV